MSAESMPDMMKRITSERRARRRAVRRAWRAGVVEFCCPTEGRPLYAAVTRNIGGGWRATHYDHSGLSGHWPRASLRRLLDELADNGWHEPAPGTFDVLGIC